MSRQKNVDWAKSQLTPEIIKGKKILDACSRDWSTWNPEEVELHPYIKVNEPSLYVGIDSMPGPNVDHVVSIQDAPAMFGADAFDVAVCLEVLEHAEHWHDVINALKTLVKPGGYILLTTRAPGYHRHGFPDDCWRFVIETLEAAFADCEIISSVHDREDKGSYIFVRKPAAWAGHANISDIMAMGLSEPGAVG